MTSHLESGEATASDRFAAVYADGSWIQSADQHSASGIGSEADATRQITEALPRIARQVGAKLVLDVGCGDWNWMKGVDLGCDYIGVDVASRVIASNKAFERPGIRFEVLDAINDPLPVADLVLCREMLFHLSLEDGMRALGNIARSATWLLTTSDKAIWFNSDIRTGDFQNINLEMRPYRFPPQIEWIEDAAVRKSRGLGLWRTSDLRHVL